ncbi:hypothetical protein BGX24_004163 [Mortierella sp. AD032]|nr:hypothetical protein BGX24_004163 [Mortierella sp. AD032]
MSSIAATINKALNLYSYYIGDVGSSIALPGKPKAGWKKYSKLFYDYLVFWALLDTGGDISQQKSNVISTILDASDDDVPELEHDHIYLHDVDITTDCGYVTTRPILEDYLVHTFGQDIKIRAPKRCDASKIYNKFVQMMESTDTMSSLGSRMESLVMSIDEKFHKRLRRARKTGLTRLEVTFYGSEIHDYNYYKGYLETLKQKLQDCRTCEVAYEDY